MTTPGDGTQQDPPTARRTILRWLIRGFLSLWGAGAAAVGISFLKAPDPEKRPSEGRVRCGPFSTLEVGAARFVRHGTDPLLVVRASSTEVQAFSAICTHLRCVLAWEAEGKRFACPCHAGAFDQSGNVLAGPPTTPLQRYPAEVRTDEIVVRLHG
jgi:cytochrome b6-f complex iron-sulfur subunit